MIAPAFLILLAASSVLSFQPIPKSAPSLGCTEVAYQRNGHKFYSYVCAGKTGMSPCQFTEDCRLVEGDKCLYDQSSFYRFLGLEFNQPTVESKNYYYSNSLTK